MAKVITLGMGKGGVGKTTTTMMLCDSLCDMGYKVLGVDFDPQGNFTQMTTRKSLFDFEDKTVLEAMKALDPIPYITAINPQFDLLPSDDYLAYLSKYLYKEREGNPYTCLDETLAPVRNNYDFILIDLPPNLGDHTINGLMTADHAIAIFQPEPFCYDGLTRYLETIEEIKELNAKLTVLGIVTSMKDPIASLDEIVYQKALTNYGDLVFETVIKRRTRIKEYSLVGVQKSTTKDKMTTRPYVWLTKEVVSRVKAQSQEKIGSL